MLLSYPNNSKLPPDFNWQKYLELNEDVAQAYNTKEGAEGHYLRDGIKQKRRYFTTNIPYDFEWKTYLGLNQDVYAACKNKTNAMMHYENHGFSESRKYKLKDVNMEGFQWDIYILKNPDIRSKVRNEIEAIGHYYKVGKKLNLTCDGEINNLPDDFNWKGYLKLNSSLRKLITSEIDAKIHYITEGYKKNAPYKLLDNDIPDDFDWKIYCELNRDVKVICKTEEDAKIHYLQDGITQERRYKVPDEEMPDDFDWVAYLEFNPDVKKYYFNEILAKLHYYITGKRENRIYKLHHTPDDFNWNLYLDINDSISKQYRTNEYTAKLHYDLFGHPQGLPYKEDFENVPEDFNWRKYLEYNRDIAHICSTEIKCKVHYNNYGIYQSRSYKPEQEEKNQIQFAIHKKYQKFPFLFHKYLLNIAPDSNSINYKVITTSQVDFNKSVRLIAHLHCFNIDQFEPFYQPYMKQLEEFCGIIIVTYSIGSENNIIVKDNMIIIKCQNIGMDIGGKYVCTSYLKQKNILYNYILFLHSKTDNQLRKLYWEPLIHNLKEIYIDIKKNKLGIFVPPLIYMGDYANIIYKDHFIEPQNITCKWNLGNSLYLNDIDHYYEFNKNNYIFPEGNCFICKNDVAESLYGNSELYNLLNTEKSFDAVWVKSYYGGRKLKQIGPTIFDIYRFFTTTRARPRIYPNNIAWGCGHKGHPDNMYEHTFERIVFKAVHKLGYKVKVMPHNNDPELKRNIVAFTKKINDYMDNL
jgi:hypothetical protein